MYYVLLFSKVPHKVIQLLMILFASKFLNKENSRLAKFSLKNGDFSIFRCSSKTHFASDNGPIWKQKGIKRFVMICVGLKKSIRVLTKIFCCTPAVHCKKCVQFLPMFYPERFDLYNKAKANLMWKIFQMRRIFFSADIPKVK